MTHRISKLVINVPITESRKLNKLTEKALKLAEQKKGLKKFKTLKELFKDLGI